MVEYCCDNFSKAIEEETIKEIEWFIEYDGSGDYNENNEIKTNIEKGFYIIDQYAEGELSLDNHPAYPQVKLSFCPYCGKKL